MNKNIKKLDATIWGFIRTILYIIMLLIFVFVLAQNTIGLTRLSRMMGVTLVTFTVSGYLFIQIYGGYDIGRRKSKPIIRSLCLAAICTDIVTYLQVMIMMTTSDISAFHLINIELLIACMVLQIAVIFLFTYGGHAIFFAFHEPEKCYIITSSQDSLDAVVKGIARYKKQYKIVGVLDYKDPAIYDYIRQADTIFVYDVPAQASAPILRRCYHYRKNVYFNPEVDDIMELKATQYLLDDIYLFNKNVKEMTMGQRVMKRLMDIGLAIFGGLITMPIWVTAMIAIKLEDNGPILFKQNRATLNGRIFRAYKLRSMKMHVENKSASQGDDRITKVGRIIRKTRIDEIPQLWNVLKGEMSIVGPRPEMVENVMSYTAELPEFEYRLRMKGGLTGYAQIAGKYNTPPKDKLTMDMLYIEEFSIWKDIQLIFQTIFVLLKMDSTEGFDYAPKRTKYEFKPYNNSNESVDEL